MTPTTNERPNFPRIDTAPRPAALARPPRPRLGLWRCPIARAAAIEVLG